MISFKPKQIELEKLYEQLITDTEKYRLSCKNKNKDYVLFGGIAGRNYGRDGLMVIGRSPNGWHRYIPSHKDGLFDDSERLFDYPDKLSELKNNNKRSKLWQVLEGVGPALFGENWEQSIIYTNYCKLSPDENSEPNGTPPKRLIKLQKDICNQILNLELDVYCPKHIIAFTGCNVNDMYFSENLMTCLLTYYSKEYLSGKSWPNPIKKMTWGKDRFVLEVYKIKDIYIYLSEHPDRKNVKDHADVLLKCLQTFI